MLVTTISVCSVVTAYFHTFIIWLKLILYFESALICIPSHCHVVDDDLYFVGRHDLFVVVRHKAEFNCRPFDSYSCVMFQDTRKLLSRFIVD